MRLVVAEKPSVARDLARVLGARGKGEGFLEGEGLRITWCVGHLVELEEPTHYQAAWRRWSFDALPMIPEQFALRPRKGATDQWKVLKRLLRDRAVTEVVNACDAGREGELIFRYAYELAGCERPILRLWTSSLTDEAIGRAWERLEPGQRYDALADAARCRSEADWLVGLNATRALTCLARKAGGEELFSVGRVQTPTLAMIVARDREIDAFVPEPFWQVRASFEAEGTGWDAMWFQPGGGPEEKGGDDEAPRAERLADEASARAIAAAAKGRTGRVETSERRRKNEPPPLLYDLTSLQRRANQRYGLSAQRTLSIAQALYEKHKLITYPRTDARYLTPDQVGELPAVLRGLGALPVYTPHVEAILERGIRPSKRWVDAEEVGDHHAIIPTGRAPDGRRLDPDEKRVFDLVARRFMAVLSPDAVFDLTTLVVAVDPSEPLPDGIAAPLRFRARGRVCVQEGWRAVDPPPRRKETDLPDVREGAGAAVVETEVKEGRTRPPLPYTDASILKAMETAGKDLDDAALKRAMRSAGLGTPATRAAILQTLLDRSYVVRKGRDLRATDKGRTLVDTVPVDELKSAELTGRWEARLSHMAEGREDRARFMGDIRGYTGRLVAAIAEAEPPEVVAVANDKPVLGDCPVCGKPVREGRGAYSCETGRECAFVVFKSMSKRKISERMVRQLLKDGSTPVVKGFRSKQGKPFEAGLVVQEDGRVGFRFPPREGEAPAAPRGAPPAPRAAPPAAPGAPPAAQPAPAASSGGPSADPVGLACPRCGRGRVIAGRSAWGCDRWREGCDFRLSFEDRGRRLSASEAVERIAGAG